MSTSVTHRKAQFHMALPARLAIGVLGAPR